MTLKIDLHDRKLLMELDKDSSASLAVLKHYRLAYLPGKFLHFGKEPLWAVPSMQREIGNSSFLHAATVAC